MRIEHRRLRPCCPKPLAHSPSRGINHLDDDDVWSKADPIARETRALTAGGVALADLLAIDHAIGERMRGAFERAAAAAPAPATHATEGVYG